MSGEMSTRQDVVGSVAGSSWPQGDMTLQEPQLEMTTGNFISLLCYWLELKICPPTHYHVLQLLLGSSGEEVID